MATLNKKLVSGFTTVLALTTSNNTRPEVIQKIKELTEAIRPANMDHVIQRAKQYQQAEFELKNAGIIPTAENKFVETLQQTVFKDGNEFAALYATLQTKVGQQAADKLNTLFKTGQLPFNTTVQRLSQEAINDIADKGVSYQAERTLLSENSDAYNAVHAAKRLYKYSVINYLDNKPSNTNELEGALKKVGDQSHQNFLGWQKENALELALKNSDQEDIDLNMPEQPITSPSIEGGQKSIYETTKTAPESPAASRDEVISKAASYNAKSLELAVKSQGLHNPVDAQKAFQSELRSYLHYGGNFGDIRREIATRAGEKVAQAADAIKKDTNQPFSFRALPHAHSTIEKIIATATNYAQALENDKVGDLYRNLQSAEDAYHKAYTNYSNRNGNKANMQRILEQKGYSKAVEKLNEWAK